MGSLLNFPSWEQSSSGTEVVPETAEEAKQAVRESGAQRPTGTWASKVSKMYLESQ